MMKGRNRLLLNQATMVEAMQLWINQQMAHPRQVTSVDIIAGGRDSNEFEVVLEEIPVPVPA